MSSQEDFKTTIQTPYDGFISYRHSARQSAIARGLQQALHGFAKPWYRLRAVRLYRDETNLSAKPDLWGTIQEALQRSRYLLLMASPDSAASPWVVKEVNYWLDTKGADSLLVVVTDGTVIWDTANARFDSKRTTALPPTVLERLGTEPLWVDLSWVEDPGRDLRLENARFRDVVASLAATLRDTDKDALTGEDLRQRRKALRLAWGAAGTLAVLSATSIFAGVAAVRQAEQARREQERATTWADRRLFTISLILAQQVEGNRSFTTVDFNPRDGLTFGMYLGWNQYAGRLGRLLTAMRTANSSRFDAIFGGGQPERAQELLTFVNAPWGGVSRESRDRRFEFDSAEWQERFRQAGSELVFQRVQLEQALVDFQANRALIAREMPELKSERGVAFMLDLITQFGAIGARRFYRNLHQDTTEAAILESLQQQSVDSLKSRIPALAQGVERRRQLFRTTPLLLDDPLNGSDLPQPPWQEDLKAWSARQLGSFRGGETGKAVPPSLPPPRGTPSETADTVKDVPLVRETPVTPPESVIQATDEPKANASASTIEARVMRIVAEQLGVRESALQPDSSFVDDLGADSLDTVELIMAFEEEFEVEIPDDEAARISTVGEATRYLEKRVAESARP